MKNLIKEIEGLKINDFFKTYYEDGWNNALDKAIEILNQYNIITAPKQIKLSEVLNRLNVIFEGECHIKRVLNLIYILLRDDIIIAINKEKNRIESIGLWNTFIELKWLYELWIAGTEIIDDMEEKENEATNI